MFFNKFNLEIFKSSKLFNPKKRREREKCFASVNVLKKNLKRRMFALGRTAGPMSWGELLSKDQLLRSQTKDSDDKLVDLDQDQQVMYLPSAERRSYFMGREVGSYRLPPSKRYPVAKRSPKTSQNKLTTDPKVNAINMPNN